MIQGINSDFGVLVFDTVLNNSTLLCTDFLCMDSNNRQTNSQQSVPDSYSSLVLLGMPLFQKVCPLVLEFCPRLVFVVGSRTG